MEQIKNIFSRIRDAPHHCWRHFRLLDTEDLATLPGREDLGSETGSSNWFLRASAAGKAKAIGGATIIARIGQTSLPTKDAVGSNVGVCRHKSPTVTSTTNQVQKIWRKTRMRVPRGQDIEWPQS